MISRLETLEKKVDELYTSGNKNRSDWADWLYAGHVKLVAKKAGELARRFGGKEDLAVAAALHHDIADAVMPRRDGNHDVESAKIARTLLKEAGFSEKETAVVVDDALRYHSCRNGEAPMSLEGKVMASADGAVHLMSDFYDKAPEFLKDEMSDAEIRVWSRAKIERDFRNKIFFDEVRNDARLTYERLKARFQ